MSDRVETAGGGVALARGHPVVLAAFDAVESLEALGSSAQVRSRAWAVAEAAARHAVLRVVVLSSVATPGPVLDGVAGGGAWSDGVDARLADLLILGTAHAAVDDDPAPSVLASLPLSGRRRMACPVIVLRGPARVSRSAGSWSA